MQCKPAPDAAMTVTMASIVRTVLLTIGCIAVAVCQGCVWPALTWADGTVRITAQRESDSAAATCGTGHRFVVVTYWQRPCFSNGPPWYDLIDAFATEAREFRVSLPTSMYAAIFTPALGTQHFAPYAGVVVFADGYLPGFDAPMYGKFCCEPPQKSGLKFKIVLQPSTDTAAEARLGELQDTYSLRSSACPPLVLKLGALRHVLSDGEGITDADRLMVYRQLEQEVTAWQGLDRTGAIKADSAALKDSAKILRGLIRALERETTVR